MRSQSVLTLGLLFWLTFGAVWKVTKASAIPSECFRRVGNDVVVGGKDVKNITQWPFMVSLFQKLGNDRGFICGGVLIGRKHVLTAAQCLMLGQRASDFDVISGLANLEPIENNTEPFTIHPVTNIRVHPNFRFPYHHDDIAILTIPSIDSFSSMIRPVCLPLALSENGDTGNATKLGWGYNGESSEQLQEANVDLVNRSTCERVHSEVNPFFGHLFPKGITPDIVCAGNREWSKEECDGGSSGPLVAVDENNVWRLVGVVSNTFNCLRVSYPSIYTRVSSYLDWIRDATAND